MDLRHFGRLVSLYLIVTFRTSISNGPKWTPIFPAFDWDHLAKIQHHGWKRKKPLKLLISIWWKLRKVQLLQSGEILHRRLYSGEGGGVQTYPHHKNVRVKLRHFVEQYFPSLWMIEWKNFIFTRWSFQDTKLLGWTRKGKTWSRGTNLRLAFAVNVTLNREIKHHVYVKRQTRICTTWPSFLFTCRLLFIISTPKLVVSLDFSSIRIVLSCYYLLIFYFENFST